MGESFPRYNSQYSSSIFIVSCFEIRYIPTFTTFSHVLFEIYTPIFFLHLCLLPSLPTRSSSGFTLWHLIFRALISLNLYVLGRYSCFCTSGPYLPNFFRSSSVTVLRSFNIFSGFIFSWYFSNENLYKKINRLRHYTPSDWPIVMIYKCLSSCTNR